MSKEKKNIYSGSFFAVLSILYLIGSLSIKNYSGVYGSNSFGSAVMPQVIGTLILVLSIVLIVQNVIKFKKAVQTQIADDVSESENNETSASSTPQINKMKIIVSLLLLVFYTLLLNKVGFIVMTSAYLIAQILFLSTKDKLHIKFILLITLLAIAFSVAVYFLFVNGFKLLLPAGILG